MTWHLQADKLAFIVWSIFLPLHLYIQTRASKKVNKAEMKKVQVRKEPLFTVIALDNNNNINIIKWKMGK